MPMTPTTPTARRQDLNQERPSTRTSPLESQHILARYTRYSKAVQSGKSVTLTDLGIFQPNCRQINSFENVVTFTFQAIQIAFTIKHTKKFGTPAKLQLCKFTGVLYTRLSFNRNASVKAKCFKKSLPNLE